MKVLYAADESEEARSAAALLEAMGRRAGLEVTVLTVAALGATAPDWPPPYLKAAVTRDADRAEQVATAAAERLQAAGFAVEHTTGQGHPGSSIVAEIELGGFGLTLMGNGTHRWLGSRLLGSTGNYVLHGAPTSVLLVHHAPAAPDFCRVLIATDGSAWSRYAASIFEAVADPGRCSVEVVSVCEIPAPPFDTGLPLEWPPSALPVSFTLEEYQQLAESREERARERADATAEGLRHDGYAVTTETALGAPRGTLLDIAAKGAFDLVVVGSRGMGPVRRALLGSVSEAVAHHARATLVGRAEDEVSSS